MKYKMLIVVLTLSLSSGCAYYNDRTTDTSKNGRIACDAEPAKSAGLLYEAVEGLELGWVEVWGWGFELNLGLTKIARTGRLFLNKKFRSDPTDAAIFVEISDRFWRLSGGKRSG